LLRGEKANILILEANFQIEMGWDGKGMEVLGRKLAN
jgi:hypothetical protein